MFKRLAQSILSAALLFSLSSPSVHAAATDKVAVSLPGFAVSVNGSPIDNVHNKYPLLLYHEITYFPMTWNNAAALGLQVSWDSANGLHITKLQTCQPLVQDLQPAANAIGADQARLAPFPVKVNGQVVDHANEPFPVLFFRDIIYFPMTWRFTNDAFGWNTAWDQVNGYRISACGSPSETAEQRNKEQLVQNNLINGGLLAVSGDWIYTNPSSSTPSLARWSKDGSSRMKLSDDNARSINVVDDWIYYTVQDKAMIDGQYEYTGIYRIRQDGKERTRISSVQASHIVVNQNWIYYLNANDTGISRMTIDGTESEPVISEKGIQHFFIHEHQLYYYKNEKGEWFRADAAEKQKVAEGASKHMIMVDGWIYYIKPDNFSYHLYKKSASGSVEIRLHSVDPMRENGPIGSLHYRDGWIYFLHGRNGIISSISLEKIRMDGTGHTRVDHALKATQLYDADPFFYVRTHVLNSTDEVITRTGEAGS